MQRPEYLDAIAAMLRKPDSCKGCAAYEAGHGFVPPSGPQDARLAIVGQGPGADEAALGEPFVGPAGRHLNKWLAKAGVPREKCAVSNVVWCHLPNNRKPTTKEIAHCWTAHVGPHLRSLPNLRVIVAVGAPAAQKFIPGAKQSTVGTVARFFDDLATSPYVVPIVHPAAIIRGQWEYDPAQPRHLHRAWSIANAIEPPILDDVTVLPHGGHIAKTIHEVAAWCGDVLTQPPPYLYVDIEGTGGILIGIGFWVLDETMQPTGHGMYVPFRDFAKPYWTDDDTHTAAYWVDRVLSEPTVPKVFHNGSSFDIPFLEEIGFEVNGYADDTMVRAWATYHEMPKSLEELAILYANMIAWKHTSHVGDEGEGK
jgi:DNA polymerase